MATITTYMNCCHNATLRWPKLQDQKSFMLHWHAFPKWGREVVAMSFAKRGRQYYLYGCPQHIARRITQDARLKIIDAPLTLIFAMGQWLCPTMFCLLRLPKRWLCINVTKSHFNDLTYNTQNCWRSIDADCQEIIAILSIAFLPVRADNSVIININDQITF